MDVKPQGTLQSSLSSLSGRFGSFQTPDMEIILQDRIGVTIILGSMSPKIQTREIISHFLL